MFVQIVTLDSWRLESRSFGPEQCLARASEIRDLHDFSRISIRFLRLDIEAYHEPRSIGIEAQLFLD